MWILWNLMLNGLHPLEASVNHHCFTTKDSSVTSKLKREEVPLVFWKSDGSIPNKRQCNCILIVDESLGGVSTVVQLTWRLFIYCDGKCLIFSSIRCASHPYISFIPLFFPGTGWLTI